MEKKENDNTMISQSKPVWRKRYLIDTQAQGRFLTVTLLYLIIFSLLLILFIIFPGFDRLSREGLAAIDNNLSGEKGFFIMDRLIPALLIYLMLVAIHSVIMTHRIFGPIYRIEQRMIEVAEGNLKNSITFRKNDYLRGLDVTINKAFSAIGEKLDEIIKAQDDLTENLDQLSGLIQRGNIPTQNIVGAMKAIQQRQEEVTTMMKEFRVKGARRSEQFDLSLDTPLYM